MQIIRPQELSERAVHIWAIRTKVLNSIVAEFEQFLIPDEVTRAARFGLDLPRHTYIVTRGFLRLLLSKYLAADPRRIPFSYTSRGKPVLGLDTRINFNVTHSSGMAAIALALDCRLGIDLEEIRPLPGLEDIAKRFFCPEEAAEILSCSAKERERSFFRCWTRKEAYIKAVGEGLHIPLDSFRVTVKPDEFARFVHLGRDASVAEAWTLHDINLASDCAAAVTYDDRVRSLAVFPVNDPAGFLIGS